MEIHKRLIDAAKGFVRSRDADTAGDNAPKNQKEPKTIKGKTDLYNVMLVAEKLIKGDSSIRTGRFKNSEAWQYRNEVFEPMLASLTAISEKTAEQERLFRKASIIIQGYFASDKLFDFITDLVRAWDQEIIDEAPNLYAKELYNNSLIYIRRQFRSMQDKLLDEQTGCGSSEKTLLERRLYALEQYEYSDCDLRPFALGTREVRKIYQNVATGETKEARQKSAEKSDMFLSAAEHLSTLFLDKDRKITRKKLESFSNAIEDAIRKEEMRVEQMQADIDKSQELYRRLSNVLDNPEFLQLMDRLNPKAGEVEGKSAVEIRELYRPLIEELTAITEEFKK